MICKTNVYQQSEKLLVTEIKLQTNQFYKKVTF
jgi:hypothetical protein